jgi:hypothetical protein
MDALFGMLVGIQRRRGVLITGRLKRRFMGGDPQGFTITAT